MAYLAIKAPLTRLTATICGLLAFSLTSHSTIGTHPKAPELYTSSQFTGNSIPSLQAAPSPHHNTDVTAPPSPQSAVAGYRIVSRWEINPVTYSIVNCPATVDCDTAHAAAQQAIEAWDDVSGLSLVATPQDGEIIILWASGYHGDWFPFDGPGGILGHTFYPLDYLGELAGDVHLDMDEQWTFDPPAEDQAHLPTTVMHEVGHALGLGHSLDPNALMWEEYDGVRQLTADDIAGIQALYGPPDTEPAAPPESPKPASPVRATATTPIRIRSGPDISFEQIGLLPLNAEVPVTGKNADGTWLFIEYEGLGGWIAGWLASVSGDLNAIPVLDVPQANSTPTATSPSIVHIRSGPGTEYSLLGSLPARERVRVIGRSEGNPWLLIEYQHIQGWVAEWLVIVEGDLSQVPIR